MSRTRQEDVKLSPDLRSLEGGAAFVEGHIVPVDDARVPILDSGFLRSDATYDVVHVWKGRFFRLDDHLDRFERSMRRLHMKLPYDRAALRNILMACVRTSRLQDSYVAMICTRGVPPRGVRDPRRCENRFYAYAVPFLWIADPEKQKRGLRMIISDILRIPPESVDPTIKNFHWLDLVQGQFEAFERDADITLLRDHDGNVTEAQGSNVFAIRNGTLLTPARGVLEGITRKTILELAERVGLKAEVRPVRADEIRDADEVFITSTAGGVMPVTTVDGQPVRDSHPGSHTLALTQLYWSLHEDPRYTTAVDYEL